MSGLKIVLPFKSTLTGLRLCSNIFDKYFLPFTNTNPQSLNTGRSDRAGPTGIVCLGVERSVSLRPDLFLFGPFLRLRLKSSVFGFLGGQSGSRGWFHLVIIFTRWSRKHVDFCIKLHHKITNSCHLFEGALERIIVAE